MWEADESLMISEIVQKEGGKSSVDSVQVVIKSLMKKKLVKVDGYGQNKKAIARKFSPVIKEEDINVQILEETINKLVTKKCTKSHLIASLISKENDTKAMEELNQLEEMIKDRKKRLIEAQKEELSRKESK